MLDLSSAYPLTLRGFKLRPLSEQVEDVEDGSK